MKKKSWIPVFVSLSLLCHMAAFWGAIPTLLIAFYASIALIGVAAAWDVVIHLIDDDAAE